MNTNKLTPQELEIVRSVPAYYLFGLGSIHKPKKILCPVHGERTPSFDLFPDGGYKCYGCGIHGRSALDLLIHKGMNFKDAIEHIIQSY